MKSMSFLSMPSHCQHPKFQLANLQLIYTCLSYSRVAVFLPIILLISLYFLFIHLEDPIRTYLHESKRKTVRFGVSICNL